METTLNNNDRLIVWKTPRTWARFTRHPYLPHRGDIIIFVGRGLGEFGQDPNKQLVKRVIALPGEKVVVKDGILTVYSKSQPNGFRPDVTMPYGKVIGETPGDNSWTVGKNQIFVCGDNRSNSLDSRAFGPIDAKDIVGKLSMRVLPLNQAQRF
jgi:signal peptidase I